MRLEADFTVQSKSHIMRKDTFMRPLITVEEERDPDFPDIPALPEMKIKPETMKMMELIMKGNASGRALITPPGVSNEKIAFLRKVTAAALKDSDYVNKREKGGPLFKPDVRRKDRGKRGKGAQCFARRFGKTEISHS